MFHPKKIVTILGLSAFMLSPVAPTFHIIGADSAYAAKGGNGGGNGNGNGGGGGNHGGGNAKSESKSAGKSSSAKTEPKAAKSASSGGGGSKLGNMNGALHASPKAVLAHIRNGNTQGPVGRLAAYVVASANAEGIDADAIAQQQADYAAWEANVATALETSGYANIADYQLAKQANADLQSQYQDDLTAYNAWLEGGSPEPALAEPVPPEAFAAIEVLDAAAPPQPSQDDIDALAALSGAETQILAKWNKNPDADPSTISPDEQALLDSLLARFSEAQLAEFAAATN